MPKSFFSFIVHVWVLLIVAGVGASTNSTCGKVFINQDQTPYTKGPSLSEIHLYQAKIKQLLSDPRFLEVDFVQQHLNQFDVRSDLVVNQSLFGQPSRHRYLVIGVEGQSRLNRVAKRIKELYNVELVYDPKFLQRSSTDSLVVSGAYSQKQKRIYVSKMAVVSGELDLMTLHEIKHMHLTENKAMSGENTFEVYWLRSWLTPFKPNWKMKLNSGYAESSISFQEAATWAMDIRHWQKILREADFHTKRSLFSEYQDKYSHFLEVQADLKSILYNLINENRLGNVRFSWDKQNRELSALYLQPLRVVMAVKVDIPQEIISEPSFDESRKLLDIHLSKLLSYIRSQMEDLEIQHLSLVEPTQSHRN